MMRSERTPRWLLAAAVFATYAATFGLRYDSAVVVLVRSYSRKTGRIS